MQEEAAIGRPLAGMVSLVARGGALTATRQGGGVGAVHGVRFAAAVLKTSAKYLKPRINLVVWVARTLVDCREWRCGRMMLGPRSELVGTRLRDNESEKRHPVSG